MKFLKDLWAEITRQKLIDTQYQEINRLHQLIEELQSEIQNKNQELNSLDKLYKELIVDKEKAIEDLELQLDLIQKEEKIYPVPNLTVDWDRFPYFPQTKLYYYDALKKKVIEIPVQWTPSKLTRIWTDEMYNFVIKEFRKVKDKTEKEQVIFLRDLVLKKCIYQHDLNQEGLLIENWKSPVETYYSGFGDCEDLTNLWLTFCNVVGIPSNKVFNLTGFYNNSGHSFGGYLDDDGTMWIVECTNKTQPIKMKGSPYRCKGSLNGISNWQHQGVPSVEQF